MENVYNIYEDWSPEPINDQTLRAYEKASQKLLVCMEHEEQLVRDFFLFYFITWLRDKIKPTKMIQLFKQSNRSLMRLPSGLRNGVMRPFFLA